MLSLTTLFLNAKEVRKGAVCSEQRNHRRARVVGLSGKLKGVSPAYLTSKQDGFDIWEPYVQSLRLKGFSGVVKANVSNEGC